MTKVSTHGLKGMAVVFVGTLLIASPLAAQSYTVRQCGQERPASTLNGLRGKVTYWGVIRDRDGGGTKRIGFSYSSIAETQQKVQLQMSSLSVTQAMVTKTVTVATFVAFGLVETYP